jgi:hypothetical protein
VSRDPSIRSSFKLATLNLDLFEGFEDTTIELYSSVRNGYLQRRERLIKGDE